MKVKNFLLPLALAITSFAVTLPRPSGEVPFTVPGKGPMKLSSFYGKVVIVAVFMTTCPHCQRTTKLLTKIQSDYRAEGLQVVELAFRPEDNAAAIQKFVAEYKPNFPVGMMDGNLLLKWGQLTQEMRPTVPMLFFIDRRGLIQSQYYGGDPFMAENIQETAIRAKLKSMFERSPAAPNAAAKKK